MKYFFISLTAILVLSGCDFSKQNRAEAAIKELMETELDTERGYEPIEFSDVQSISYSTYIKDYIEQKKLELDSVNARIKNFEEEHAMEIDSLMLPSIQFFGGIAEGKKLLKDREQLKKQIEEKEAELEKLNDKMEDQNYVIDSLYLLYHTYKLSGKTDTAKQIKRKNFILSPRYRVVDVYNNNKPDPLLITREKKFDLE